MFILLSANNLKSYTLRRLLCKTIRSIRSLYLKTSGNGQLSKTRVHSYFQRKKHLMTCQLLMQMLEELFLF